MGRAVCELDWMKAGVSCTEKNRQLRINCVDGAINCYPMWPDVDKDCHAKCHAMPCQLLLFFSEALKRGLQSSPSPFPSQVHNRLKFKKSFIFLWVTFLPLQMCFRARGKITMEPGVVIYPEAVCPPIPPVPHSTFSNQSRQIYQQGFLLL